MRRGRGRAAGNLPPGPSRPGGRLLSQLQLLLETAGPMGAEGYGRRERPPGAGSSRKRRDSCLLFLGPKAQSPAAQTPHLPPDTPSAPSGGSGNRARGGAREATPTRGSFKGAALARILCALPPTALPHLCPRCEVQPPARVSSGGGGVSADLGGGGFAQPPGVLRPPGGNPPSPLTSLPRSPLRPQPCTSPLFPRPPHPHTSPRAAAPALPWDPGPAGQIKNSA